MEFPNGAHLITLASFLSSSLGAGGVSERGGTAEMAESLDSNSSKKCTLLIRKFNLDSDGSDSPGTKTEVSEELMCVVC